MRSLVVNAVGKFEFKSVLTVFTIFVAALSFTHCSGSAYEEMWQDDFKDAPRLEDFQSVGDEFKSVGTLDDPQVAIIPEGARRFYYAGAQVQDSTRVNALGDAQVLYYDVYEPKGNGPANKYMVLFFHGGGYQGAYANEEKFADQCRFFATKDLWCASVEYRRGWLKQKGSLALIDFKPEEVALLTETMDMAKQDALDAWDHIHAQTQTSASLPSKYILVGTSAGGSIISRISLTNPDLDKQVAGAIVGFGTHEDTEAVISNYNNIPVVLQGGLGDTTSPLYTNHAWFNEDLPRAKGMMNLYEELESKGFDVRFYLSAQRGHGFGFYNRPSGIPSHYSESLQFFQAVITGNTPANFVEFGFSYADPRVGVSGGDRIRTTQRPGFRYEPYQTQLESGLSPYELTRD
jgi:acetyl esterase/lipase